MMPLVEPRARERVAVLVLTHDRDDHLLRQHKALALEPGWDEAVVCFMNQAVEPWDEPPARVRTLHLDTGADGPLNLAAARNAAARASDAEVLIFLDADCLPAPGAVERLALECEQGRLVMADPRYLPPGWDADGDPDGAGADPARAALPHPSRTALVTGPSQDWHMFWSLGFAIRATDLARVGGFDEAYEGYGGEDTDLAFRCRDTGMSLWMSAAQVLHQPHPVYRPPLQHLESIVVNARRFHERWDTWPMEGWLRQFAERGLVSWGAEELRVLRIPDRREIEEARVESAAFG